MEAAYITMPTSLPGKSIAREVEEAVIKTLQEAGFPLLSVKDASRKRASKTAA